MEPSRARSFMKLQAETYARRVAAKEIHSSAVEALLTGDAQHATDSSYLIDGYIDYGLECFRTALNGRGEPR